MKVWEIAGSYRGSDGYGERHEEEMIRRKMEEAYEEGCRDGYEKAMREMSGGYGERSGGYGMRGGDEGGDGYGERRGVKYTGRYSRYR